MTRSNFRASSKVDVARKFDLVIDRKSTRLNSSHEWISYAVFCLKKKTKVLQHPDNDMTVPFVSGSTRFDAMVIVPCSMSTLGRIATGSGQGALLRAADVFLEKNRKLIVVPRETPWSLIQARNVVTLIEAGAIVLPAIPSFYSGPKNVNEVADTVVWRILDQLGLPSPQAFRWQSQQAGRRQI